MDNYKKRRNWIIGGGIAILVLILLISFGFLIRQNIYSAKINIMVVPSIAEVKIGNSVYKSFETVNVQPGEYNVEVSAEGFAAKTGKLVAKAGETVDVKLYLEPSSTDTENWYNEHPEDALIMGEIINSEMLKETNVLLEKEPALKSLPVTIEYYSDNLSDYTKYVISYAFDDSERGFRIILKDYTGEGLDVIKNKLVELGFDLNNLNIDYENFSSDALNYRAE